MRRFYKIKDSRLILMYEDCSRKLVMREVKDPLYSDNEFTLEEGSFDSFAKKLGGRLESINPNEFYRIERTCTELNL